MNSWERIFSSLPKEIPVPAIDTNILGLTLFFTFNPQNTVTTKQNGRNLKNIKQLKPEMLNPMFTLCLAILCAPTTYSNPTRTWMPNSNVKPAVIVSWKTYFRKSVSLGMSNEK